jgi:hypothetical protein
MKMPGRVGAAFPLLKKPEIYGSVILGSLILLLNLIRIISH